MIRNRLAPMKRRFFVTPLLPSFGRNALTLLSGLYAMSLLPAGKATPPPPPNGDTLAREMISAYRRLTSLEESSETKISVRGQREYIQTGTFRYKRPGLFTMTTTDPYAGTFTVQADGRLLVVYSGKSSVYARRNSPASLPAIIANFQKISKDEMGVNLTQTLSPLSFLTATGTPTEVKSFRYVGLETYDSYSGRKAHHISGIAKPSVIKELTGGGIIKPVRQNIDIWIDPKTSLAVRIRCDLAWYQSAKNSEGKTVQVGNTLSFDEVKKSQKVDGAMDDKSFRFDPPKGATLKFPSRKD